MSDEMRQQSVLHAGLPLDQAAGVMLLLHGRGAEARGMLGLAREFDRANWAYFAPQAAGNVWWPYRFTMPLAQNEPWVSNALDVVSALVDHVVASGVPYEKLIIGGFSQGACLALEWAAQHPRRYGGVLGLSGGLIGNGDTLRPYTGSLENTPVFLGCSDKDFHIHLDRVEATADVFTGLNANLTKRIYPNMGHTIIEDEIIFIQELMDEVAM